MAATTVDRENEIELPLRNRAGNRKLGFVRGDKTALGQLIETAEVFAQIIDRYTPATAQPFATALEVAKETYSDGDAMQGDVAEAESSLLQAMLDLRYKADKSVLEQVMADAANCDLTGYTAESVAVFNAANDAAKAVYGNPDAAQQEVDDAASALTEAVENLERITSSTQQPAVQGDKAAATPRQAKQSRLQRSSPSHSQAQELS